ncbi:hypothetical protein HISP_06320 [Haloarcula hispanica N601]|uniref:Uncharacterized protein n=3 Tax=Haloarcula hispanica TaxID=51589 RepID=V5TKN6_HALHI|nr:MULTISPECIES: hypothetical protein [Haloarcula]AEM56849.1 conserved hypothetical protein [Haloarcula hispanica ATCC 33960]AHB65643.1 hypothetical protein HISP_06320 [Haloarcula hispanica N601]KZX48336.1 hypothetical protein AV929_05060 [Haloarcula sp. K1]MCJ0618488.1 hypothetical protein [Haloarcula hispanica]MUV48431.1 hypothetical protein [Haloarcula sp. CBA1122]
MQRPTIDDFREIRRGLPVGAALLFVAALAFPMWHISVDAVQYPSTTLHVSLYAYPHLTGDFIEMARLNHYVGFYFPDPVLVEPNFPVEENAIDVPEWALGPVAFIGVSLLSVFVAVAPTTEKLKRGLKYQFGGTVLVFTVMLADIQYRLWQAGHTLDPGAPVMGVDGFTPPLWGQYQVANITSVSRFGLGAYMAAAAVGLLAVSYYYRDQAATFSELPARFRSGLTGLPDAVRDRLGRDGDTDDEDDAPHRPTTTAVKSDQPETHS